MPGPTTGVAEHLLALPSEGSEGRIPTWRSGDTPESAGNNLAQMAKNGVCFSPLLALLFQLVINHDLP